MEPKSIKFAIVGAGSVSFCPATLNDILLSDRICSADLSIALMDIREEALNVSEQFAREAIRLANRSVRLTATTKLEEALEGADFVVTAIEVDRYHYWSMDFHIPRRYGFRQVYGENGGPGGMFHALRNMEPMLHIARTMEKVCPDAWLLNYTNPEAKLVEAISKLTRIKVIGLCHGEGMGREQLSQILGVAPEDLTTQVVGLNHFGWFTKIARASTGEDLYPLLREREGKMDYLARFDEIGLSRIMFRAFGLYPYPGTNHIGEYVAWSDEMLASAKIQYFFDPAREDPWGGGETPEFVYSFETLPPERPLFKGADTPDAGDPGFRDRFTIKGGVLKESREYGIPIAESIAFGVARTFGAVNVPNHGFAPNLPAGMAVEIPALVDAGGVHPLSVPALPTAIASMIQTQGAIHQLLIEAYQEKSRKKLLQAILIDPTVSNYQNAVALIDEMCLRQKGILPEMHW